MADIEKQVSREGGCVSELQIWRDKHRALVAVIDGILDRLKASGHLKSNENVTAAVERLIKENEKLRTECYTVSRSVDVFR